MDLSGINFRSVAESTDFSFSTSFKIEGSSTGLAEFSLSGENKKIKFDFKSGKIFDNDGRYIYSYRDSSFLSISGDASSTKYSYYIDDQPFALGVDKDNFKLQKLCHNTTGLSLSNVVSEVKGTAPDYFLTFPETFIASGNHTGHLVNNSSSFAFRMLDVEVLPPHNSKFSISSFEKDIAPNDSGKIVVNNNTGVSAYAEFNYDVKVHTNFGPISSGVTGTAQPLNVKTVTFSVEKVASGISDTGKAFIFEKDSKKTNVYGIDYSAFSGVTPSGDLKLHVSLEYNNGTTGDFFNGPGGTVLGTAPIIETQYSDRTLSLSGSQSVFESNLFSTGETTGQITGIDYIIGSGYVGPQKRVLLTGISHTGNYISGYNMGDGRIFAYASGTDENSVMSGISSLSPTIPGSGETIFIATGSGIPMEYYGGTWNYTPGNYVATTGELTGLFTGMHIVASDYGSKYYSRYITGNVDAITTGDNTTDKWGAFLNPGYDSIGGNVGMGAIDSNYAGSGITGTTPHSGLWTGVVFASGDTYYSGTGEYSGRITGYTKSFTGSFDLVTGQSGDFSFYRHGIGLDGAGGSYIYGPHGNIGVGAGAGNVGMYTGYKNEDDYILIDASGHAPQILGVRFTATQDYEPIVATLKIEGIDGNVYTDRITGVR